MARKSRKSDVAGKGKTAIKFKTRRNAMPDSTGKNRYFGVVEPNDTVDRLDLIKDIAARSAMGEEEVRWYLNAIGMYVLNEMQKAPRIFDLGFCRLVPVIKGRFRYKDEPFDPKRHKLTVAVVPSPELTRAVQESLRPVNATPVAVPSPRIDSVCYGPDFVRNTISAARPFELHGSGLTTGAGDESAALELPSGEAVPLALEPQTAEDGTRRVKASLAAALPQPRPRRARLVLMTHGLGGAQAPLVEVRSAALKVLA